MFGSTSVFVGSGPFLPEFSLGGFASRSMSFSKLELAGVPLSTALRSAPVAKYGTVSGTGAVTAPGLVDNVASEAVFGGFSKLLEGSVSDAGKSVSAENLDGIGVFFSCSLDESLSGIHWDMVEGASPAEASLLVTDTPACWSRLDALFGAAPCDMVEEGGCWASEKVSVVDAKETVSTVAAALRLSGSGADVV